MVISHNVKFKRELAKSIAYLYKNESPVINYLREG